MRRKSRLLAVVSTTMQVWVPLGQFLLLFLTMTPPPGIVSVHQTELFLTPQPHLCSSFCLTCVRLSQLFLELGPSHLSSLSSCVPSLTKHGKWSPRLLSIYHCLFHVGAITSSFFCLLMYVCLPVENLTGQRPCLILSILSLASTTGPGALSRLHMPGAI